MYRTVFILYANCKLNAEILSNATESAGLHVITWKKQRFRYEAILLKLILLKSRQSGISLNKHNLNG